MDSNHTFNNNALTLAKQGVSKQYILSLLCNTWELSDNEMILCELTQYYKRKWTSEYVRSVIINGVIHHNGTSFTVIYRNTSPAKILMRDFVNLSFRSSSSGNFVIIQPYSPREV